MAKAKEITGLDCAADALEWAATVLRVRFDEIATLREAALAAKDIEGVHAMRVATRRLRSALRDFLPLMKKRPLKRVRRDLKQLADALGAARDEDVALVALEKLQAQAPTAPLKRGINQLIGERRAVRERAQRHLMKTLDGAATEDLRARFTAALDEAVNRKKTARAVSFNEAGREAVAASLREFCDLSAGLYEPSNDKGLHELRISAKRLRYAIELFVACWGERIAPFAAEVAGMQSFLGEVHDADVWIEALGARLRKNGDGAAAKIERGSAIWLLDEFVKDRTKNYRGALRLWGEWQENDFVERLKATVLQTNS